MIFYKKRDFVLVIILMLIIFFFFFVPKLTPNLTKKTYTLSNKKLYLYQKQLQNNECNDTILNSLIAHYIVNENKKKFKYYKSLQEKCQKIAKR